MSDSIQSATRDQEAVSNAEIQQRRAGARRTALILGAVVLAIFVAFLITGVTGRG